MLVLKLSIFFKNKNNKFNNVILISFNYVVVIEF